MVAEPRRRGRWGRPGQVPAFYRSPRLPQSPAVSVDSKNGIRTGGSGRGWQVKQMRPRPRTSLLAAALAAPLLLGIGAAAVGVGAQEDRSSSAKGPTAAGRIGDAAAYDVY